MTTGQRVETASDQRIRARNEHIAHVEIITAMAVAGSSVVAAKTIDTHVPVFVAAFLSFAFALVVSLPLQAARRAELKSIRCQEFFLMAMQALFGMVLFRLFLLYGLRHTSALNAGIVTGTGPAVTILLGCIVFRERFNRRKGLALALSVAGIIAIHLGGTGTSLGNIATEHVFIGDLLVFCAVISESLLTVFRKLSVQKVSSVTNMTMLSLMSTMMTFPFALGEILGGSTVDFSPQIWLALGYYGAFVTVVGYLLWGHAALRMPAGKVGIAAGAMPLSSCLLSALLLGESFDYAQGIGCALVVISVLL